MPNGESKNWIRFLVTLERFYYLYGKWPGIIYLYPFFIKELQEKLPIEEFKKLQSKIKLEPDGDNPFYACDEIGNVYDYTHGNQLDGEPSLRAIDWLEINEPDYYD